MAQPTIPVTALFSPELEAQTKQVAIQRGVSRGEVIRLAVVEFLKKFEAQPAPTPTKSEVQHERQPA